MRPTLSLTLGFACFIDLGMIFLLETSVLAKILLVPIIGFCAIFSFAAGHYIEEKIFTVTSLVLAITSGIYFGIFSWLEAPILEKKILLTAMMLAFGFIFILGWVNEGFNRTIARKFGDHELW